MINLGIIGTNWITHQFVQAAYETGKYCVKAVYSRKKESAEAFAAAYGQPSCYTDLEAFFASKEWDTVYIASPNSLHFQQAKQGILSGKHVIVEKPAFSTIREMQEIVQLAEEKKVFFFEAARNIHEAGFKKVQELLNHSGEILGANFTFMKYSSRYDSVLAGEEPNIFSLEFSGGALMDLGVYVIYAAVAFFGMPQESHYFMQKVNTGVDGMGTIILQYPTFHVTLSTGKIADSFLPSEIYTDQTTIQLNAVNSIESVQLFHRKTGVLEIVPCEPQKNPMVEEANDFANIIVNPKTIEARENYQKWTQLSLHVNSLINELRTKAGIFFAADKNSETE